MNSCAGRAGRNRGTLLLASLTLAWAALAAAQMPPAERTYKGSPAEIEKALRDLGAYSAGRLPALEGFVGSTDMPLERFERPYYQFHIEIVSAGPERTTVRLTATITAWYADPEPSRAEYRKLPSNGRLELDLFDRLDEYLKQKGAAPAKPKITLPPKLPAVVPPSPPGSVPGTPPAARSTNSTTVVAAFGAVDPGTLAEEIARTRSAREKAESQVAQLQAEVNELEKTLRDQVSPQNLAFLKASRTPVRAGPSATAPVLFLAEAEDTFEILENRGDWIQLNLGAGAQGWVQGTAASLAADVKKDRSGPSGTSDEETGFEVTREEITLFSGEWTPLKSQRALFVWVRPATEIPVGTLGQRQLAYAKRAFAARYAEASHAEQPFAGVVVVFLSPKGGVAAATVANVERWRGGALTEETFLKTCSLDPPEAFHDSPKP